MDTAYSQKDIRFETEDTRRPRIISRSAQEYFTFFSYLSFFRSLSFFFGHSSVMAGWTLEYFLSILYIVILLFKYYSKYYNIIKSLTNSKSYGVRHEITTNFIHIDFVIDLIHFSSKNALSSRHDLVGENKSYILIIKLIINHIQPQNK